MSVVLSHLMVFFFFLDILFQSPSLLFIDAFGCVVSDNLGVCQHVHPLLFPSQKSIECHADSFFFTAALDKFNWMSQRLSRTTITINLTPQMYINNVKGKKNLILKLIVSTKALVDRMIKELHLMSDFLYRKLGLRQKMISWIEQPPSLVSNWNGCFSLSFTWGAGHSYSKNLLHYLA